MNCSPNIITANFSGGRRKAKTAWRHQWDRGQVLCVTGIEDLPLTFETHFAIHKRGGTTITVVGIDGQVDIPSILLTFGKDVYAWIYVTDGDSGETVYTITIPVIPRPMPEYYEATDTGAFDRVVEQVSGYAESADDAATRAATSATAAAQSASAAAASEAAAAENADRAEYAMREAVAAQNEATTQSTIATEKASQASGYATAAAQSATDAAASKTAAANAATAAGQAASAAGNSAATASTKAEEAEAKAGEADQSATDAAESATAAAGSATAASGSAATAAARAAEAANSAGQAATARDAATTAQGAAETAASGASQSATAAAGSATAAAGSATAAAGSAATAGTKADDAAASAAAAAASAASLTVDSALSDSSTNPVQNKIITGELTDVKTALIEKIDSRAIPYGYEKYMNDISIWEGGGIDTASGVNIKESSVVGRQRIRTKGYISDVDFIKLIDLSGSKDGIFVYAYDSSDTYIELSASRVTEFSGFDYNAYKYRVALGRTNNEELASALSKYACLAKKLTLSTEEDINALDDKIELEKSTKVITVEFEKGRYTSTAVRYYNSISETKSYMINKYPILLDGAASVVFPTISPTDSAKYNIYFRDSAGNTVAENILTCRVDNNSVSIPNGSHYLDIMVCYSGVYDIDIKIIGGGNNTGKQVKRIYTNSTNPIVSYFAVDRERDVYSSCCYMLPPNYSATGDKVPLVLWFDGNMNYRTLVSKFKDEKLKGLAYIRDEGYAVLQIFSWGSYFAEKYPTCGDDQPYPTPTCLKVLYAGLRHFLDRYNIDFDNVHIMSKSMGGLISLYFATHPIHPFKSICMFSPILDMFGLRGRYADARKALAEDNNFQGDVSDFYDINRDGTTETGVENYYFSERCLPIWNNNKGATARLNSAWTSLVGGTFTSNLEKSVADARAWYADNAATGIYDHTEYKKMTMIPVKIWGALHDPDVPYLAMPEIVEQIRNSGGYAEIRPVDSYDHSRFDVSTNGAKTVTTELGIVHENVPIGWVEGMEWIRTNSIKYAKS